MQDGTVVWTALESGQWCGNDAQQWVTVASLERFDGWCEDCITKRCEYCRHD